MTGVELSPLETGSITTAESVNDQKLNVFDIKCKNCSRGPQKEKGTKDIVK